MSELASVRISYETLSDRTIDGTNTEIGLDQWEVRAPFFYKESGDWKIAAGIRYQSTDFEELFSLSHARKHETLI